MDLCVLYGGIAQEAVEVSASLKPPWLPGTLCIVYFATQEGACLAALRTAEPSDGVLPVGAEQAGGGLNPRLRIYRACSGDTERSEPCDCVRYERGRRVPVQTQCGTKLARIVISFAH